VRVAAVVAVVLALVAGGCSRDGDADQGDKQRAAPVTTSTTAPRACTPARPAAPGPGQGVISFGGVDRRYLLHIPAGYTGTDAVPVVFDFHGHGSNATQQVAYSEIRPLADREGFVVVAPEGQGTTPHFTLLGATATEADDVELTTALLDRIEGELCIDPARVYALGMSNGGAMSSVLACRAADRFAAVGAVAAIVYLPACEDARRATPIAAMMGTADPVVPFAGGRENCCGNPTIGAASDTMARFARHAGCDPEPAEERIGTTVVHRHFEGCEDGAAVELYVIEGGGHTWPGSPVDLSGAGLGATTKDLRATETLWSFFEQHRLPGA
jgi:polyhydroxybutyrate depolymerase